MARVLRFELCVFRRSLAAAVFLGVWFGGGTASGHISLLDPPPRTDQQKQGPCGTTGLGRGDTVAVFAPGDTVTVLWDETIDHDSHYRIALDVDGDDDLVAPDGDDDLYNSPTVLVDGIPDERGGGRYSFDVILPDVECERCVLQLIQVMYGAGNYFQCADIAIRREGGAPPPVADDAGAPPDMPDGGVTGRDASPSPPAYDGGGEADAAAPAAPGDDPPTGAAYGTCSASSGRGQGPKGLAGVAALALLLLAFSRRPR